MNPALIIEIVAIVARYWVPIVVYALFRGMKAEDQQHLIAVLTSTEMLTLYASTLVAMVLGLRAWLKKTRFGLTAAALSKPATPAQIAGLAQTLAPPLSTRANDIPQLTIPYRKE